MPNKPVMEMYAGSVRVTAWENEQNTSSGRRPVLQFTVERRYVTAKGDWRSSPRFYRGDLLQLAALCQAVYAKLSIKERDPNAPSAPKSRGSALK